MIYDVCCSVSYSTSMRTVLFFMLLLLLLFLSLDDLMTLFSTLHFHFPNMESVVSDDENNNQLTFYKLREKRSFDLSSSFMPLTECYVDVCECLLINLFSFKRNFTVVKLSHTNRDTLLTY